MRWPKQEWQRWRTDALRLRRVALQGSPRPHANCQTASHRLDTAYACTASSSGEAAQSHACPPWQEAYAAVLRCMPNAIRTGCRRQCAIWHRTASLPMQRPDSQAEPLHSRIRECPPRQLLCALAPQDRPNVPNCTSPSLFIMQNGTTTQAYSSPYRFGTARTRLPVLIAARLRPLRRSCSVDEHRNRLAPQRHRPRKDCRSLARNTL